MTSPLQQKIKVTGPVVVTANRVSDGAVVYRRPDGRWSTDLGTAAVAISAASVHEMIKDAAADGLRAVDPYVAPVTLSPDGKVLRPGNLRETIRLHGPTIELPVVQRSPAPAL